MPVGITEPDWMSVAQAWVMMESASVMADWAQGAVVQRPA